jgi:enoyl-CoA hydratase/carnithine racemase
VILYREEDGIGELSFNDPERLNAMGEEMALAMREQVAKLKRARPRVLILRGEGRAFSAGGDLAMLERKRHLGREENRRLMIEFYGSYLGLLDLEIPLVAALHGHAVGAGMVLACACDLRVADPETRMAFPFARLGLHPGMGATYFLPRLVGAGVARELLLTGTTVDAHRALSLGLVNQIASPVLNAARNQARSLLKGAPEALRDTLLTLRGNPADLSRALEHEALCQADSYAREEFAEGLRAALEKRS